MRDRINGVGGEEIFRVGLSGRCCCYCRFLLSVLTSFLSYDTE